MAQMMGTWLSLSSLSAEASDDTLLPRVWSSRSLTCVWGIMGPEIVTHTHTLLSQCRPLPYLRPFTSKRETLQTNLSQPAKITVVN